MLLPKKRQDETDDEFIARCMSDETMQREYPDQDQRNAVCHAQLEGRRITPPGLDLALLAQLQAEIWAMEPRRLQAFLDRVSQRALLDITQIEAQRSVRDLRIEGRTAVILIEGILLREVPWFLSFFGINATSYGDIRRQVLEATGRADVDSIRLEIDSPGGAVGGITEVLDALFEARQAKRLEARIEEMGTSAAYWLAATAEEISAEPNAQIGSIGVYTVLVDSSTQAVLYGLKVHLVRAGELKGAGIRGVPISAEQLANEQQIIEDIRTNFVRDIAQGRDLPLDRVQSWATGAIWLAARAQQLGLIDGVRERKQQRATERAIAMEQEKDQKTQGPDVEVLQSQAAAAARAEEQAKLKAFREAFPDDIEYALASYDGGVTLAQAQKMYDLQIKRIKAAETKTEAEAATKPEGAEAVTFTEGGTEQAGDHEDFLTQARRRADARQISVTQAMRDLAAEEPKLHQVYLEQCQQQARPLRGEGVQRLKRSSR